MTLSYVLLLILNITLAAHGFVTHLSLKQPNYNDYFDEKVGIFLIFTAIQSIINVLLVLRLKARSH